MIDQFLFVGLPYAAVAVAVGGGIVRYRTDRFSYSSQSSQFLENRSLFWGSNAWHYGILIVLFAHFPPRSASRMRGRASLRSEPALCARVDRRSGSACSAFFGLLTLVLRRLLNPRVAKVSSRATWLCSFLLAVQVGLGLYYPSFYVGSDGPAQAVPWLESARGVPGRRRRR